jgi:hypothetical protein
MSTENLTLSVQDAIEYSTYAARLDGIVEGVRLMAQHLKAESLAAIRSKQAAEKTEG